MKADHFVEELLRELGVDVRECVGMRIYAVVLELVRSQSHISQQLRDPKA